MSLVVGYDATAAARQRAGIGRYARELLGALLRGPTDIAYRTFACVGGVKERDLPLASGRVRHRSVPLSDRVMNAVWHRAHIPAPVQLFTGSIDLFHSPDFTLPPVWRRPTVLTVHDLAFMVTPEFAYPTLRAYLERTVPASIRRASHVIAVSECTRQDLIERLGVSAERITTILEGVGPEFVPAADPDTARHLVAEMGVTEPYLLAVGTLEPRKNYERLFEAYAALRAGGHRELLIICGRQGWFYEPILRRRSALGLEEHVIMMQPDSEQLVSLYQAALAVVYPSIYEGFGLPPLEAMACGAPVACSNTSSLPEVVGDAALTFDPKDVHSIAAALERILTDRGLRADLVRRGLARAQTLSWDRAATETVAVYRRVASHA